MSSNQSGSIAVAVTIMALSASLVSFLSKRLSIFLTYIKNNEVFHSVKKESYFLNKVTQIIPAGKITTVASQALLDNAPPVIDDSREILQDIAIDFKNIAGPVRSQGNEEICTAFAIASALEVSQRNKFGQTIDLSERHIWSFYEVPDIITAAKKIDNHKIAPEHMWGFDKKLSPKEFLFAGSATLGVTADLKSEYKTISYLQIADTLAAGGGVALITEVTKQFQDHEGSTFLSDAKYPVTGAHAVSVVGIYVSQKLPQKGYLIIKNSWGKNWGDKGFAKLPLSYCSNYHCGAMIFAAK